MKQEVYDRFKDYKKNHCWQYEIRQQNLIKDLQEAELTQEEYNNLRIEDFEFSYVDKEDKESCDEIKQFIQAHEWLGNLPNRPTHRFVARLRRNNALGGVVIMAIPNAFSHIMGKENKFKERLISRGACISWAPKNLGSWLIMTAIKHMVKHTEFRTFSAYSDPEAKELGTIYQACNFIYLGQKSGTAAQFYDNGYFGGKEKGWFTDREFRKKSMFMKYAKLIEPEFYKEIGFHEYETKMFGFVSWEKAKHRPSCTKCKVFRWKSFERVICENPEHERRRRHTALRWKPNWKMMESVYPGLKQRLKEEEEKYRLSCEKREMKPKHKYIYILGRTKKETKKLKKLFDKHNPGVLELAYPRERGE